MIIDDLAGDIAAGLMRGPGERPQPGAATVIARAEAAVARIDRWGTRGITGLSADQIEAMALVIAASGAIATLRARLAAPRGTPADSETTKPEAKGDTP